MSERIDKIEHLVQYGWKPYAVKYGLFILWNEKGHYGFTEDGGLIEIRPRGRECQWNAVPDYRIDDFYSYARRTPGT